tara:strand:- start:28 stop:219 length:192 start_codon:yes stop_codon:yes gene_type:complete
MLEADKHINSWKDRISKSDYTQAYIANKLGMDKEYFNRVINKRKQINMTTYRKIENILQKLGI